MISSFFIFLIMVNNNLLVLIVIILEFMYKMIVIKEISELFYMFERFFGKVVVFFCIILSFEGR